MEEFLKRIESMLEKVLEEEREFIDGLCLDEEYDNIEDIPIEENEYIDFGGKYGWQIRRDYEYISEKKAVLVKLKNLLTVISEGTDSKRKHCAKKELERLIEDSSYFISHKKEDIDEANAVIDVMDNVLEICQNLSEKRK